MRLFFLLSILVVFSTSARAEMHYGLAMHGQPKYGKDFSQLEYVNPKAPKGGKVKMLALGTFDSLNPFAIKGSAAQGLNLYYDRLMARVWDEAFTMYPLIAEKVEIPKDRSSITVFINPNARFHDGSPITADDVIFSFETLRDFGRPNMRRVYKLVDKAEKKSDLVVHFKLGDGYDRETVMILAMMPVLSEKWWEDRDFDSSTLEPPLSSGPYRILEVDPGKKITFERDPNYWAAELPVNIGHYNFDQITYDYYRDDTVAFEAFKAGEYDIRREWDAGKWVSSYDFPATKNGKVIKETLEHGRPERVRSMIFNTRRAPFDDRRIRKALINVLDFEWLNENLFHSQYKRISSFFPNSELAAKGKPSKEEVALLEEWREDLPPEVFETSYTPPNNSDARNKRKLLKESDALLKESGWPVVGGKRVNKESNERLTFEILIASPEDEKIALSYIKSLKKLGIDATARISDEANYTRRLNSYDFDMTINFWQNSLSPGTEQMLFWSCESAEQNARWNYPGICNPAVDDLSQKIAHAENRKDLITATHALDRVLTWGHYTIPLYYAGHDRVAYKNSIKHPKKTPMYGMVIETWWSE